MRYALALLLALTLGIAVALPLAFAQDGPSVCRYRDGTVLNVEGWPCPQQPYWNPHYGRMAGRLTGSMNGLALG